MVRVISHWGTETEQEVIQTGNEIFFCDGGSDLCKALKVNKTITKLQLGCENTIVLRRCMVRNEMML